MNWYGYRIAGPSTAPEHVMPTLVELLHKWGPPSSVGGLFETGIGFPSVTDNADRSVDLISYGQLVFELGEANVRAAARLRGGERQEFEAWLERAYAPTLQRDVEWFPHIDNAMVYFEPRPRTLEAFLWRYVIGRSRASGRAICRYCGNAFTSQAEGRGRPPTYCAKHREPRCYQAVAEHRAPWQVKSSRRANDGR